MKLLPTPTTRDHKGSADGFNERRDGGLDLPGALKLLPTPCASDATGGGAQAGSRKGHTSQIIDAVLCSPQEWAEYEPAIRRWEKMTRPAPAPTEPTASGGRRYSAAFGEWMMGWPKGWVTDLITTNRRLYSEGMTSHTQAIIRIGNGVVPQQAAEAIEDMLVHW